MSLGSLSCNFKIYVRKVHTDWVGGELFHKLTEELKSDTIVILEAFATSSFGTELNSVKGVHVAGDPEILVDGLLLGPEGNLLLNQLEKPFDLIWVTKLVAEDHTTFLEDMIDRVSTVLVLAGTNKNEILFKVHAFQLLKDELLFAIVQILVFELHTGLHLEHIEFFLAFEIDVDHGIDPESLCVGWDTFESACWSKCLAVVTSHDDWVVTILERICHMLLE